MTEEYTRAKKKALYLLSRRDYGKAELIKKLGRDFDPEAAEAAAERLEELGLINDENYAKRYFEILVNTKMLAPKTAKYMLSQKGLPPEIVEEISEETEIDEVSQIRALIEKKYKNSLDDDKGTRRAAAALARKGYAYSDIKKAMRDYIDGELYDE